MAEEESGFIQTPDLDAGEGPLTLIHESENGPAMIYRATKFGQFVVLKCLKPQYRDNRLYETLLRKEFEIGYGLNHPNVCRTTGFVCHPSLGNAIEMEWVDGVSIKDLDSGLTGERFMKVADELCNAVAYLHSHQIVHRDIKPSNIMLTHSGDNVKLLDFGLADSDSWAVLKAPAGTRSFMAPEVIAGGVPDMRSDLWSMGKVLSTLTNGHRAVLGKCCALRPENRYSGALEVKRALGRKNDWPLIAAAIVLGAVLSILMPRWKKQEEAPVTRQADTVYVDNVAEKKDTLIPAGQPASPKHRHATQSDIDAVFQAAGELFD